MGWPTPQEYNEAIQNPAQNLADAELQKGSVALDTIGLPRVASGNFASVYKIRCAGQVFAVRCFLYDFSDQGMRYERIASFLASDAIAYTASFDYLKQGILVQGSWFPVLKMDWIDGQPLDLYVKNNAHAPERMRSLAEQFKAMCLTLRAAGIAHGDLQHGNILVLDEGHELKLVDYDGMFVPALSGGRSNELGHRNYQHPHRGMDDFNTNLDNFAAWSIYTSLLCLSLDPELATESKVCDECLLFRFEDYRNPLQSRMFSVLEGHSRAEIRVAARRLRFILGMVVSEIPGLDAEVVVPPDALPPLSVTPIFSVDANVPLWMKGETPPARMLADARPGSDEKEPEEAAVASASTAPGPAVLNECPSLRDYLVALKEPKECLSRFADLVEAVFPTVNDEIKHRRTPNSIIVPVYAGNDAYALKLFLTPDELRSRRYHLLQSKLQSVDPSVYEFLVPFDYFESGIKVKGRWYPLLRMKWLGGVTLRQLLRQPDAVGSFREIARELRRMIESLTASGLIHGDLEPDNIMIVGSQLKLVDYDLMRPSGAPFPYPPPDENYCHPKTALEHKLGRQTESNDNLAAWLLDTQLVCFSLSQGVRELQNPFGDLFSADDLRAPQQSSILKRMEQNSDPVVVNRTLLLRAFLADEPEAVPPLRAGAAVDREYARRFNLQFYSISADDVSPDARSPMRRNRLTALGEVEPSYALSPGEQERRGGLPAPVKSGSDIPFYAVVFVALMVCIMLGLAISGRFQ